MPQIVRYAAVGAIGTSLHYSVLVGVVEWVGADPLAGTTLGFLVGAIVNYVLNYRFTFNATVRHRPAVIKFFGVAGVGLILNAAIVSYGVDQLEAPYLGVQLVATAVVLGVGFTANRFWTFRERIE